MALFSKVKSFVKGIIDDVTDWFGGSNDIDTDFDDEPQHEPPQKEPESEPPEEYEEEPIDEEEPEPENEEDYDYYDDEEGQEEENKDEDEDEYENEYEDDYEDNDDEDEEEYFDDGSLWGDEKESIESAYDMIMNQLSGADEFSELKEEFRQLKENLTDKQFQAWITKYGDDFMSEIELADKYLSARDLDARDREFGSQYHIDKARKMIFEGILPLR